jgi:hypothetical protein
MGQDISKSYIPPPLSLRDCYVDGEIDLVRYRLYRKRQYKNLFIDVEAMIRKNKKRKVSDTENRTAKKPRTPRSVKRHHHQVRCEDGSLRNATSKDSNWYSLYIDNPPNSHRLLKRFRNRFRVPYPEYLGLVDDIKVHEIFSRWFNNDCTGSPHSDIRLLVLGSLRHVGRGHTFDDIEESTFISRDVHRVFFNCFIEYGSTVLYKKYVIDAASKADVAHFQNVFGLAGFDGAMGSSDGTNIGMLTCPNWAVIGHKGFKLAIPSRNYNATVTHARQILGTTCGHPGTWNDKTVVLFDDLIKGVNEGKHYQDNEFSLFEKDENGDVVKIKYKGVWFIVDNGYLNWSCTVPPMKHPTSYQEIRFSEWLESMRKDVECTFGILKGRFLLLKYGIRSGSIEHCDKVWLTCCALHNKLLFIDGLHKNWENGAKSYYEDKTSCVDVPFAIERLNRLHPGENPVQQPTYDRTIFDKYTVGNKRVVKKMPLKLFQDRLIHHFDIRFKMNDIVWPQRHA